MFEDIFRIVIAKISILTLNRINATEPRILNYCPVIYSTSTYLNISLSHNQLRKNIMGISPDFFLYLLETTNT